MGSPTSFWSRAAGVVADVVANVPPAVPAKGAKALDVVGGQPPAEGTPPAVTAPTDASQEPPPPPPPPEPAPALAAPTLDELEKKKEALVAKRTKLQRFIKSGGDDLPLGQTISGIHLAREEVSQRKAKAEKDLEGISADLLHVLGLIADASSKLGPIPIVLPKVAPLDRPPEAMGKRTAKDIRRRIREAETGRRELPSTSDSVIDRSINRLIGRKSSATVETPTGPQTFTEVGDIDPWFRMGKGGPSLFGAPPGQPKPVLGQLAGELAGSLASLPREAWEEPSGFLTFPFIGSSAAEGRYRRKHGRPYVLGPLGAKPGSPLPEMEKLGLDPAKPEDRRKWEEEEARQWRAIENRRLEAAGRGDEWRDYDEFPSLVPGGGRDPQAFVLAEDPLFGQWAGFGESPSSDPYSDKAYQKAMGSGLMTTATGERPEVRDMSDVPMEERRSHFEGLSLDDRVTQARGEFLGAQMVLTEINAAIEGSIPTHITSRGNPRYEELQAKKAVTEDFVYQAEAIIAQLRRQQYRRAVQAKWRSEPEPY